MTLWQPGMRITDERLNDAPPFTVEFASITANTATTTTTETVGITTAPITFRTGRAYRITLKCLAQSSVSGDNMVLRVRKTDTSGTAYIDQYRVQILAAAANMPVYFSNVCANTTAADINAVLVATYLRNVGTGNVIIAASVNNVAFIHVEDLGDAADYPSATAIT